MQIHKIDKLTDERWLNLYAAHFSHKDKEGRWLYASRRDPEPSGPVTSGEPPIDAVVIVAVHTGRDVSRLVLIREFRIPVGGYIFGLPAGLIDPGETVEGTVRRELKEETGLDLVRVDRISQGVYSSSGMTDEATSMAFVEVTGDVSDRPELDSSEDIEPVLLDFGQVEELVSNPQAHLDVKAWLVLHMFSRLGSLDLGGRS